MSISVNTAYGLTYTVMRRYSGIPGTSFERTLQSLAESVRTETRPAFDPAGNYAERYGFRSTGEAGWDYMISLGIEYRSTCWDDTHQAEFDDLTAAADYTGMTDEEKYLAIYGKYQYCCGENFLDTEAVNLTRPPRGRDDVYGLTTVKFYNELIDEFGSMTASREIRCMALYGTDDEYEVRQAIIDKYVTDDGMTYIDFCKMANEMAECGVDKGLHGWVIHSINDLTAASQGVTDIFEYIDYLGSYTRGVNDRTTLMYAMLDQKIGSDFVGRLEYYAYQGKGEFADVLEQVMAAINKTSGSGNAVDERFRGTVSGQLVAQLRRSNV